MTKTEHKNFTSLEPPRKRMHELAVKKSTGHTSVTPVLPILEFSWIS